MDDNNIHGLPDYARTLGLTAAESHVARLTGISGEEIIEHKKRKARGDFKQGMKKPLAVILLGD